jgi:hypothetical protein
MKFVWPLIIVKFFSITLGSLLALPILQTLVHPLSCEIIDGGNKVMGFDSVSCNSTSHYILIGASAFGATSFSLFALFVQAFFFNSSAKCTTGKLSGNTDLFYYIVKFALVLINTFVSAKACSILSCILLASLCIFFLFNQPYFNPYLNNLRFATFFAALIYNICSIIPSFSKKLYGNESLVFFLIVLAFGLVAYPGGFYLNALFFKFQSHAIYDELEKELSNSDYKDDLLSIHNSHLDLHKTNVKEVLGIRQKKRVLTVFPTAAWIEISARFIQESYLNDKSVMCAMEIFDVGFRQHPRSATVFPSY